MSNFYQISYFQIYNRLTKFKLTDTDAINVSTAIMEYLFNVGLSYPDPLPFQKKVISLSPFDLKFLKLLMFDDSFCNRFISVFLDYSNKNITISESLNKNHISISQEIGLEDRKHGLYIFAVQASSHPLSDIFSLQDVVYLSDQLGAEQSGGMFADADLSLSSQKSKDPASSNVIINKFGLKEYSNSDRKGSFVDSLATQHRSFHDGTASLVEKASILDQPVTFGKESRTGASKFSDPKLKIDDSDIAIPLQNVDVMNRYKSSKSTDTLTVSDPSRTMKYPVIQFLLTRTKSRS